MGASTRWTVLIGVVLVGHVWSAPLSHPIPAYNGRLSSLELAIIKCIVETVPGATKGGGGSFDWSVVQSMSKELEGVEVEVVRVAQREPDFTDRSEGHESGGYPSDWNIIRSVSSQHADVGGQGHGGEGLSGDWTIVKSISTELHLDPEEVPGDDGIHFAYQAPVKPGGGGNILGSGLAMMPDDHPRENHGGDDFHAGIDEYHHHIEDDEVTGQVSGDENNGGGAIGWNIVRSQSNEQEPISEEISSDGSEDISSHGNEEALSSSEDQDVEGDDDSYNVLQSISPELQPAAVDNEAGEIPTSLTEMVPPKEDHTGGSWNSQSVNGGEPSEVQSSETVQLAPLEGQESCKTGHKRIRNVCTMVHTFQLKSHIG